MARVVRPPLVGNESSAPAAVPAGGALAMIGHLVSPAEMGFYGVGWAGAQFGYTVSLNGAAQGLIALGKVERGHIAAAQALSLAISLVVALVLVVAAPVATSCYASAHYGEAVLLGAGFVPMMSLGAVDIARAQKALLFSRLAVVQTIAVLLAAPLSLPTNPGSWSMCFQHVRPCDVVVFRCWVVTKSPACPP